LRSALLKSRTRTGRRRKRPGAVTILHNAEKQRSGEKCLLLRFEKIFAGRTLNQRINIVTSIVGETAVGLKRNNSILTQIKSYSFNANDARNVVAKINFHFMNTLLFVRIA
jgi:hypothetical protein